jgi:hypothetical protein
VKYEIGYSSAGGFMVQEFHEDDPIAREAAVMWNRRIVELHPETLKRWHEIEQAWWALQREQRTLYADTPPWSEDSLVLTPGAEGE